jgi:hypothetical protein
MTGSRTFRATIDLDGATRGVRVVRAPDGDLQPGSPDDTTLVEQLLVYDLADDVESCDDLVRALDEAASEGAVPARRAWNVTRLTAGASVSLLELAMPGGGEPARVRSAELRGLVLDWVAFLDGSL